MGYDTDMPERVPERGDADWLKGYNSKSLGKEHPRLLVFSLQRDVTVAKAVVDELCHAEAPVRLRKELTDHLVTDPNRSVVLDLSEVDYAASALVGTLLWLNETLKDRGARLALAGVHWRIHELLELCGIAKVVPTYSRPHEAVSKIAAPPGSTA
jgi:anti-anti-sigma factor